MFDDEQDKQSMQTDSDVILRIDYLDMRVATRIERLEERVRRLEEQCRLFSASGEADLGRLRNLPVRLFSKRPKHVIESAAEADESMKAFPIKAKHTTIVLCLLCGFVSFYKADQYPRSIGETLGFLSSIFLISVGIPALLAYVVAGQHQQHSRRDKWYFWGALISSGWLLIRLAND